MSAEYLNQVADRADAIARRAEHSFNATGRTSAQHTHDLARLVVALAAHLRDEARAEGAGRVPIHGEGCAECNRRRDHGTRFMGGRL